MYKLLFVDDEVSYKLTVLNMVDWASLDFEMVGTARNGAEALKFLQTNQVHAIITSVETPVMDGISLIHELQRVGFTGPILAVSNYSDYSRVRGALTAGAFDYLLKRDLSAEQLSLALHKMSVLLSKQAISYSAVNNDSAKQDRCIDQLQSYLLEPTPEDLPPHFTETHPELVFPCRLCTIKICNTFPNPLPVSKFLQTAVLQCFKDIQKLLILPFHNDELIILLPQAELERSDIDLYAQFRSLARQIKTFLSTDCLISITPLITDISGLKPQYNRCLVSYGRSFYRNHSNVLFLPATDDNDEFLLLQERFISDSMASLKSKNSLGFQAIVHEYIKACAKKTIFPTILKDSFMVLAWCCRDLSILTITTTFYDLLSQIETSPDSVNLEKTVISSFAPPTEDGKKTATPVKSEIAKIILYVNRNYTHKITLKDIADYMGFTREYLSRLFIKETGINLFQYILEIRMQKAAELLSANSNILIKEVALAVGFDNQYSFSSKFKKHFGVSPNNYKEKIITLSAEEESSL